MKKRKLPENKAVIPAVVVALVVLWAAIVNAGKPDPDPEVVARYAWDVMNSSTLTWEQARSRDPRNATKLLDTIDKLGESGRFCENEIGEKNTVLLVKRHFVKASDAEAARLVDIMADQYC